MTWRGNSIVRAGWRRRPRLPWLGRLCFALAALCVGGASAALLGSANSGAVDACAVAGILGGFGALGLVLWGARR